MFPISKQRRKRAKLNATNLKKRNKPKNWCLRKKTEDSVAMWRSRAA